MGSCVGAKLTHCTIVHQHRHSNTRRDPAASSLLTRMRYVPQAEAAGGLRGRVAGSGSDCWSLGQMQLVCLARAALNEVPVLCMDEATAALDPHTEKYVLVCCPLPRWMCCIVHLSATNVYRMCCSTR